MMEAIAVSISFLSSLLLMLALVAKKRHQLFLYNMMPRDVIKELPKKRESLENMNALDVMSELNFKNQVRHQIQINNEIAIFYIS